MKSLDSTDTAPSRPLSSLARPFEKAGFRRIFPITFILLALVLLAFIRPGRIDASDFRLIAWDPGHQLLSTGSVYAGYPYPMWTLVVLLPFAFLSSPFAELVWFLCNLLMLSSAVAFLISLIDWKLSLPLLALMVLISGFFLPVLTSAWLGQLTIFSLFTFALALFFFLHHRYTWLGIALGLSLIKPQVTILLVGLVLLWGLWQRHWRTLISFSLTLLFLTLISLPFIASPAQILGGGISNHLSTYIRQTSTLWGFLMSLGLPWVIPALLSLALLLWLGWLWLPLIRGKLLTSGQVIFLFSFAILVNLAVIPYSWMHNLALALLPFYYCFSLALKLPPRWRLMWSGILILVMHPLTLLTFVFLTTPKLVQSMQIIPALILFAIFVWMHHRYSPSHSLNNLT